MNLSPRAQRIVAHAELRAIRDHSDEIDPQHLLLGILDEEESIAAGVLHSLVPAGKIEEAIAFICAPPLRRVK
jgi:ATP-dependent Clp protease ATP-binding subunit ClpA